MIAVCLSGVVEVYGAVAEAFTVVAPNGRGTGMSDETSLALEPNRGKRDVARAATFELFRQAREEF
jgi:hypothetical protein